MTTAVEKPAESTAAAMAPVETPVSSFAMLRTLGGIAALSGLLLALTYQSTFARIEHNKEEALRAAVFAVLPGAEAQKAFVVRSDGGIAPLEGDAAGQEVIYAGYDAAGGLVGLALEARGQGYGDIIRVLYGYDLEKEQVIGFNVLDSKETPGLGDKIAKAPFTDNFTALDVKLDDARSALVNPIVVVKNGEKQHPWEIDGITGATISSKAIGGMLQESAARLLPVVQSHADVFRGEG